MTHDLETYGLILLFALVAVESCGIPLPGETALIAAAVLASSGRWNIVEVIAIAAVAAFIGDNVGYWIARKGGRPVIAKIPIARDSLPKLLPKGEVFFEKHGPKTVVIGRFFAGLRVTVAWLAGLSHMEWRGSRSTTRSAGSSGRPRSGSGRTTSGRPRSTPSPSTACMRRS